MKKYILNTLNTETIKKLLKRPLDLTIPAFFFFRASEGIGKNY